MKLSSIALVLLDYYRVLGIDCAKGRGVILPGGNMEQGETFHECASRELSEETGLAIGPADLSFLYSGPSGDGYICHCFVAKRPGLDLNVLPGSVEGPVVAATWEQLFASKYQGYYRIVYDILVQRGYYS